MRYRKLGVVIAGSALVAFFFSVLSYGTLENLATTCGSPILLAHLPDRVPAPVGELTLYADYRDRRGDHVVLYLVNRTDRDLALPSQDGDIYVKLETLGDSGYWERAQRHQYSGCGNSYWPQPKLNAGHFFKFLGYFPREGERTTVRYRMYSNTACAEGGDDYFGTCLAGEKIRINLVSDATQGFVLPEIVEHCRRDSMSASYGCFEVVARIATDSTMSLHGRDLNSERYMAIIALRRFGDTRSLEVLQRLLEDDDELVRLASVDAIALMAPKLDSAAILHELLLTDEDSRIRAAAVRGLAGLPWWDTMMPYLEGLLEEPAPEIRIAALHGLIALAHHCDDALKSVEELINDPDPTIRKVVEVNLRIIEDRMANPEKFRRSDELWAALRKSN